MDSLTKSIEDGTAAAVSDDPYIGTVLGQQYRIDKLLGRGGMGTVYQGVQLSIDRIIAVKVIAGDADHTPELVARFKREAQAMAQLRHPNTVRLLDFGVTPASRMFMVMEWLRGEDLETRLAQRGPLKLTAALHIVRQVAQSLSEAHARGIVHRDLKPGNIFLAEVEGGECFVKVMDFGVAGFHCDGHDTAITMKGAVLGTAAYMAPEQAQGNEVDGRADLYSLGVILFEMLTGRPPFIAKTPVSLLLLQVSEPPPRIFELCPAEPLLRRVQGLLDSLLAKDRGARLRSATEVIAEIDHLLSELGGSVSGVSGIPPMPRGKHKHRVVHGPWLGAALSLFAMCAGGVFAWQWSRGYDQAGIAMQPNVLVPPPDASGLAAHSSWLSRLLEPFQSAHFAHVTIASVPSGATVSLAGAELGTTPYSLQLKGATIVELSLPGHASQRISVEPGGEPNLVIKLVPLPPFRSALQPAL